MTFALRLGDLDRYPIKRMANRKPTLTQKRLLNKQLKAAHGSQWEPWMNAKFDKRNFASIFITRFDPAAIAEINSYPTHFLELHPEPDDDPRDVRASIPILLQKFGSQLERLEIRNTADSTRNTDAARTVIPRSSSTFANLPKLTVVDFVRVNVTDGIVKAVCHNPKLYAFHADDAPFTRRCVDSFSVPPKLRILTLSRCRHFPHSYEATFKRRVPSVEIIRLKDPRPRTKQIV